MELRKIARTIIWLTLLNPQIAEAETDALAKSEQDTTITGHAESESAVQRMVIITSLITGIDSGGAPVSNMAILPVQVPLLDDGENGPTYAELIQDIISEDKSKETTALEKLSDIYVKDISNGKANFWTISLMNILNCHRYQAARSLIKHDEVDGSFYITDALTEAPYKLFCIGNISQDTMKSFKTLVDALTTVQDSGAPTCASLSVGIETDLTPLLIGKMTPEFAETQSMKYFSKIEPFLKAVSHDKSTENAKRLLDFAKGLEIYVKYIKESKISFDTTETLMSIELFKYYLSDYLNSKYKEMLDFHRKKLINEIENSFAKGKWLVQDSTLQNVKNEIMSYLRLVSQRIVSTKALELFSKPENFDREKNNFDTFEKYIKFWTPDELNTACIQHQLGFLEQRLALSAAYLLPADSFAQYMGYVHFLKFSLN